LNRVLHKPLPIDNLDDDVAAEADADRPSPPRSNDYQLIVGIVCGVAAAVGYTIANGFLRQLAGQCDAAWVSTIKAACLVVIFGPWLGLLWARGTQLLPGPGMVFGLIGAALFCQFGGNLAYQLALGHIGLALSTPLTLGMMIVASSLGGRWLLGESVSRSVATSLVVLMIAIVILSLGSDAASQAVAARIEQPPTSWLWTLGAIEACLAGLAYSALGISIRAALRQAVPLATPMIFVGVAGVVGLGSVVLVRHGWTIVAETTSHQWLMMLIAGMFNAGAFLALSQSLRSMPVIYVNVVNVLQVGLGAIVGVVYFAEPLTIWLICGLILLTLGLGLLSRQRRNVPAAV
jgi:drug/metabolite transporter (DMT)-like permease